MLTSSAHTNQHHHHLLHHLPQSTANNNMPVAASPCSTSSSSLGYHQASSSSMSSSVSDLLNSSHSSFGESSASSVRSLSAQRHEPTSTSSSSVPRVRTIRLKRPSIPTNVVQQQPQQPMQSRNLLIGGGGGGGSAAAVTSMEMSGLIASPSNSLLFGFSIRGGSEYRTGFFVSHVEPAGEADVQGVQVGDQIIRVNNHPVDDATHSELSQYIANQSHLTLRVRNIGMIPVKDRDQDPLTWQMVHQDQKSSSSSDYDDVVQCRDIMVTLSLGPKEKLGLGICKGPEWKPGIFVQFTKEHGIARKAHLKPGDQILSCNGVEFQDIFFNDAVAVMKSSSHLELVIRTAVGLELFPGESSGYNSSASSVTGGDQSPCWNESGRRYDLNPSKLKSPFKPKSSSGHRDRLMAVNTPKVPQLISFQNTQSHQPPATSQMKARPSESNQNTTVIKLSEEGTIINNTLIPNVPQQRAAPMTNRSTTMVRVQSLGNGIDYCGRAEQQQQQASEQRTVVVEVHRGGSLAKSTPIPPPPPLVKGNGDVSAPAPVVPSMADEIKRRAESLQQRKQESSSPSSSIDDRLQQKAKANGVVNTDQHNQLMDEFKKAHQRMFKNGASRTGEDDLERQREQQQRNNEIDRDQPDSVIQVPVLKKNTLQSKHSKNNYGNSSPSPPPPPPPEPFYTLNNGSSHDDNEAEISPPIEFADDVPKKTLPGAAPVTLAKRSPPIDNRIRVEHQLEKPTTPTPDYDSLIYSSEDQPQSRSSIPPPPPPLMMQQKQQQKLVNGGRLNGSAAAAKGLAPPPKPNRTVSVTIGEYDSKREPSRLGFLNKANQFGGTSTSEMLQNELQMTLSRSNLKNSSELAAGRGSKKGGLEEVPVKGGSKSVLEKTGSANIERLTSMLNSRNGPAPGINAINSNGTNKVTISIPKTKADPEVKVSPNGILKTVNGGGGGAVINQNGVVGGFKGINGSTSSNGSMTNGNGEVKNIKFDNITTVIGIRK